MESYQLLQAAPSLCCQCILEMTDHSKLLKGEILEFNERTWWGIVSYDLTTLEFHGTCYRGCSSSNLPKVGQKVTIILNRAGYLLSVESCNK